MKLLQKIKHIPRKTTLITAVAVLLMSGALFGLTKLPSTTAQAKTQQKTTSPTPSKKQQAETAAKQAAEQAKKQAEQAKAAAAAAAQTATASTAPQTYPAVATVSPKGKPLYVDPSLAAAGRPAAIASQATSVWFGEWTSNVGASASSLVGAATSQGKLATIVVYNIPARDCGSYSAGGAGSSGDYRAWIRSIAAGIGKRQAIIILEPDALAQVTCLNANDQAARYADLADAVNVFATQTKASVYLDAGHSAWVDNATMAARLQRANIAQARGFSLNVSNFQTTSSNIAYGNALASRTGKNYVIDTSRNGLGSNGEWCNPRGRALGERPTTSTTGSVDAYLWIKQPGESDGACNGGPAAGVWWQEYAEELIRNAGY